MLNLEFCGHAAVLVTSGSHNIVIDPFFTDNPAAVKKADDINVDTIIITHGHGDHIGDTESIAKRNKSLIISNFEIASFFGAKGFTVHPMHIGGSHDFDFGSVKLTYAQHGSAIPDENGGTVYGGNPCGVLLTIDGKTIFHAGDTGLFGDMKLIGDRNDIDCAILPIGDNFTMGVEDAAYAVELLNPKKVIPIHYDTWPVIEADVNNFAELVGKTNSKCEILKPGETIAL